MANIFGDPFFPLFSNGANSGNNLSFFFRAIAPAEATPAPVKTPGSPVSMVRIGLGPIGRGLGIVGLGMGMVGFSVEPGLKSKFRSPADHHFKALLLSKAIFWYLFMPDYALSHNSAEYNIIAISESNRSCH